MVAPGVMSLAPRWLFILASIVLTTASEPADAAQTVPRWGVFELALEGPQEGNPFTDVDLRADFAQGNRHLLVRGFYDGDGKYRVRFMPPEEGTWRYTTLSNVAALDGKKGELRAGKPEAGNRGPVRADGLYFAFADGTPFHPIGTTVYALPHQPEALQKQTLETLRTGPFNKIRFCVLPKWYSFNKTEPLIAPFQKRADGRFDVFRPDPAFFRLLEQRVLELQAMGIEVDLILFHPYDEGHWGFDRMGRDADHQYLRYVIARLGAYRNVWWSMANEWDLVKRRTVYDWNQLFDIVKTEDPYGKLCSIHQAHEHFDHDRAPITHVSVQNHDGGIVGELRRKWKKPAINDECEYEGDIEMPWGNIDGRELVHRMWQGSVRGGYVGHGETFQNQEEVLWWSKGGALRGESPPRIKFLREILEKGGRMEPVDFGKDWVPYPVARQGASYVLYLGRHAPRHMGARATTQLERVVPSLKGKSWKVEIIDPWDMKVTAVPGTFREGDYEISLPGRMFLAVRLTPIGKR